VKRNQEFDMETSLAPRSLGQPGFGSDVRAFLAVVRREWRIFTRYQADHRLVHLARFSL
jgi:hypothetical protein